MKDISRWFATLSVFILSLIISTAIAQEDIVIENNHLQLVVASNGVAKSLRYKSTNEECLQLGDNIPLFSVTQEGFICINFGWLGYVAPSKNSFYNH